MDRSAPLARPGNNAQSLGNGSSLKEMHVTKKSRSGPQGAYPRLTQPLVRDNGVLRPASWDEALDRAADGFQRNLARSRTAAGIFSCSKSTNEVNFLASKFARAVFGNNNVDSCNRT
jgi:formate dehydrogenase major subunit